MEEYKNHESECAEIVKEILSGLKYIHEEHELIHRDIKPGNILLTKSNFAFKI